MASLFVMLSSQVFAEEGKLLNLTLPDITCSRIRTAQPKYLILVSFFSGENTPSTDTIWYVQLLPEVCRSVFVGGGGGTLYYISLPPKKKKINKKIQFLLLCQVNYDTMEFMFGKLE